MAIAKPRAKGVQVILCSFCVKKHRAACACHGAVEAQGFCEKALIIMKNPSSTLLKMHDVVAVLYMLELQPVSQPSKPLSKDRWKYDVTAVASQ